MRSHKTNAVRILEANNIPHTTITYEINETDLSGITVASGNKKVEMIKEKELLPLTGYTKGGCSPIGMKKKYPTYIDETVQLFEEITVSAGIRGMQVKLKPEDLLKIVDGVFAELIF
ncbi:MAG: YbaK/EbsC family protein [Ignavibacteriaceae bacterium]